MTPIFQYHWTPNMRNIFDVNRSVAGHYVDFTQDRLSIIKGDNEFSLPVRPDTMTFSIDSAVMKAEGNVLKCTVSGWAASNADTSPAKSIYISYNNKIISRAKSNRRLDARISMDLTFDHCGFECNFNIPKHANPSQIFSLIMVGTNSCQIHYFKITNNAELHKRGERTTVVDRSVVRPNTPSFSYKIESATITNGILRLKGWCCLNEDPSAEVYINFVKSGIVLGDATVQTISRPEVGQQLELPHGEHFFGFDFSSHDMKELPLNPKDTAIDMLLVTQQYNKKEMIRIYSE